MVQMQGLTQTALMQPTSSKKHGNPSVQGPLFGKETSPYVLDNFDVKPEKKAKQGKKKKVIVNVYNHGASTPSASSGLFSTLREAAPILLGGGYIAYQQMKGLNGLKAAASAMLGGYTVYQMGLPNVWNFASGAVKVLFTGGIALFNFAKSRVH